MHHRCGKAESKKGKSKAKDGGNNFDFGSDVGPETSNALVFESAGTGRKQSGAAREPRWVKDSRK